MAERELFPSNSNKQKDAEALTPVAEREHAKPVAKRVTTKKKDRLGRKFADYFFDENIGDIGEYLVKDLIVPMVKDTIIDFMTAALWGDRRSGSSYRDSNGRRRTDYAGIGRSSRIGTDRSRRDDRDREDYSNPRREFDIDNIVFRTREEADAVLTRMEDYMAEYGHVTVGYLYELMEESAPYTAEYYGWRNLDRATIRRVGGGHELRLPRPVRIEK